MKPHEKVIPRFDLIVLDPPSFTRNRASVPDALRGYKEIHLRALKLLKPGGTLATFCCSHHVGADLFQDTLLSAAFDTRHVLRRVATYAQSPDHPIIPMIPETEYLKGFAAPTTLVRESAPPPALSDGAAIPYAAASTLGSQARSVASGGTIA